MPSEATPIGVSPSGIREQADELREELLAAATRVLDSGWFVLGQEVEAFELEFAEWVGAARADRRGIRHRRSDAGPARRGVGPGDEVIVPANALPAVYGVAATGARLRFADVRRDDLNIDPAEVERLLSARTAAIVAVHLYGHPAAVDELDAALDRHRDRVTILEDCAQAHGATARGPPGRDPRRCRCLELLPDQEPRGDRGRRGGDDQR